MPVRAVLLMFENSPVTYTVVSVATMPCTIVLVPGVQLPMSWPVAVSKAARR
ncbi:Uncharacterised protein [Mycobacterium tuberculosis]|nr:Uncharacterised protein [Mycobacterium tuberculosis]